MWAVFSHPAAPVRSRPAGQASQGLFKLEGKQNRGEGYSEKIRDRLGGVYSRCLRIWKDEWQNINQRDQQYKFAHDGYKNRGLGVAERGEGHLAGDLDAEQQQAGSVKRSAVFVYSISSEASVNKAAKPCGNSMMSAQSATE